MNGMGCSEFGKTQFFLNTLYYIQGIIDAHRAYGLNVRTDGRMDRDEAILIFINFFFCQDHIIKRHTCKDQFIFDFADSITQMIGSVTSL